MVYTVVYVVLEGVTQVMLPEVVEALLEVQEELGDEEDCHEELLEGFQLELDSHLEELEDLVETQDELEDVVGCSHLEVEAVEVVFIGQAAARVVRNEKTETVLMEFILSERWSE